MKVSFGPPTLAASVANEAAALPPERARGERFAPWDRPAALMRSAIIAASLALLDGCATTAPTSPADPFEPWNRAMYDVHQVVDGKIVKPVAQAYVDYTPQPIQQTVRNFFGNIEDAFSALTALMSGKLDRAGNDMGRVIINTLFGIGGLIDVASDGGIPKGDWDFGLACRSSARRRFATARGSRSASTLDRSVIFRTCRRATCSTELAP
jgi:hypothetical protein